MGEREQASLRADPRGWTESFGIKDERQLERRWKSQVDLSDIVVSVRAPEDDTPPPLPKRPSKPYVYVCSSADGTPPSLPLGTLRSAEGRRSKSPGGLLTDTSTSVKSLYAKSISSLKDESTRFVSDNVDAFQDLFKLRKGKSGLCRSCAKMPLDQCFGSDKDVDSPYLQRTSYLSNVVRHGSWCELCRILALMLCRQRHDPIMVPYVQETLAEDWLKGTPFHAWASKGSIRDYVLRNRFPVCIMVIVTISTVRAENPGLLMVDVKAVMDGPQPEWPSLSHFTLRAVREGLSVTSKPHQDSSYACVLDPSWIDLSMAKMWLSECESHHGKDCSEPGWAAAMPTPNFIRLIDVIDLCVIGQDSDPSPRFVALSYVWGGANTLKLSSANVDDFSKPGGLRPHLSKIPRTILHAMQVVRSVGERYLWCDALCIMQEATLESQEQINNMDRVYGTALFTIVAASGEDANAGLPGVTRTIFPDLRIENVSRTVSQPVATLQDGLSVIAPFTRLETTNTSPRSWNRRAWTFQERLLSRRLLIFSKGEMTWHCRTHICHEDTSVEQSGYSYAPLQWLSLRPQHLGVNVSCHWKDGHFEVSRHGHTFLVRSQTFADYAMMVAQYSQRSMTFEGDVLNALAGLLRIFSRAFRSEYMAGLPAVLLDVALLWHAVKPLRRRAVEDEFPSWSWAGWEGGVAYTHPVRMQRDDTGQTIETEGVRPLLRYFVFNPRTNTLQALNGTSHGLPLTNDDVPAEWEASYSSLIRTFPLPEFVDLDSRIAQNLSSSHLIFYTSVVHQFELFDLRKSVTSRQDESVTLDSRAIKAQIRFQKPSEQHTPNLKLILVAEASGLLVGDHQNISDFDRYLVMLVKYNPTTGLTSRRGIGTVLKSSWAAADPVTKLICLG